MTAEAIAEMLINGNISATREVILGPEPSLYRDIAVLTLDVLDSMIADHGLEPGDAISRLRRCLDGGR